MKKFLITLCTLFTLSFFLFSSYAFASGPSGNLKVGNGSNGNNINNDALNNLQSDSDVFFTPGVKWEKGIKNLILNIARDAKNVIFIIATIIMFVLVFRLLFWENSDEEATKFKNGIIWTAVWLVVMQISFVFYKVMFDTWANSITALNLSESIIEPFIKLLMTGASFVFIAVAIYAFYKIVTANGDEDAVSKGKMTIFYGILWFIVIKFTNVLVESTYGKIKCGNSSIFQVSPINCIEPPKLEGAMKILTTIINWVNGFLGIIVVLLIIYAGFLIMTGRGDEEKSTKAKSILLYALIGFIVLVASYMILTFFILPESPI